ncbi:hypothetical protein ANN_09727 [Periplaneta americana]|uniref:Uncharacterized protein n=1 Tax=Periplaneta americana TaxID=6978 RepID=A0ABQ8TMF8_PERAM|nr:hypothetical protein ANN_09727 [Periplaneta americana]
MAGLCEGGNEPSGSLKAICKHNTDKIRPPVTDYVQKTRFRSLLRLFAMEAETRRRGMKPLLPTQPSTGANLIGPHHVFQIYPAFAHIGIGLRENPGQNLKQVTCPDQESKPGHLVSRPEALTVSPQIILDRPQKKWNENVAERSVYDLDDGDDYDDDDDGDEVDDK